MIKNHLHNGRKERIVMLEDKALQSNLSSIIGRNTLLSNADEKPLYNCVRWATSNSGVLLSAASLHLTKPLILRFANEEIKGDQARNTDSGWYFRASVEGIYQLTVNTVYKLFLQNEGITRIIYDNYIQSITPISFDFYRNSVRIAPNYNDLLIYNWNPHDTTPNPFWIGYDGSGSYYFKASKTINYYLNEMDKIDIRVGFTKYTGVADVKLTYWGDVQINLLENETKNYKRVIYA
jgi:hypothetical protein